jgi:hypothetical protein
MFTKNIFFCRSIAVIFCLLSACSTQIQIAGEEHKLAAEKWKEFSHYTTSQLPALGYTVTAKLGIKVNNEQTELNFTRIKIERKADYLSLDLLQPQFADKYLCTPQCTQFVEYDTRFKTQGQTLLDEYLAQHEFQLFDFYAEIFVLNDVLLMLYKENPNFLHEYLSYLAYTQGNYSNLDELIQFLKTSLSIDNYNEFISNPRAQYIALINAPDSNLNIIQNSSDKNWEIESLTQDPTSEWDLVSKSKEQLGWQKQVIKSNLSIWHTSRAIPVEVNTSICTLKDNYFGVVQSILNEEVEVFIQGQGKHVIDGTVRDLDSGSLFQETVDISFMPLLETRTFPLADIAPCSIQQ